MLKKIYHMKTITIKKHNAFLIIYILLSFSVYLGVSDNLIQQGSYYSSKDLFADVAAVEGNVGLKIWADSAFYTTVSKEYDLKEIALVFAIHPNTVGPFIILKMFNSSELLIYILNVIIFLFSVSVLIKYYPVNKYKFVMLLCISPMLLSSLLAINKEIFAMLSMSMFLVYLKNKNPMFLIVCVLSAFLTRWEMVFVVIVLLISFSKYNFLRNKRAIMIAICLVSISMIFPFFLDNIFAHTYVRTMEAINTYEGGGTGLYTIWLKLQTNYCYFLAFIPKTIHALIGAVASLNINNIINKVGLYHSLISVSQSFVYLFLLIQIIIRKKINIDNDIFFIAVIFCIFINLSFIVALRYLFPLHLLLALLLSTRNLKKHMLSQTKVITPHCVSDRISALP